MKKKLSESVKTPTFWKAHQASMTKPAIPIMRLRANGTINPISRVCVDIDFFIMPPTTTSLLNEWAHTMRKVLEVDIAAQRSATAKAIKRRFASGSNWEAKKKSANGFEP